MSSRSHKIAYQGEPGANSHLACRDAYPKMEPLACPTFEDALAAVKGGEARLAMIPIENSVAGRVADIHHLLPDLRPLHRRRAFRAHPPSASYSPWREAERAKTVRTATPWPSANAARRSAR